MYLSLDLLATFVYVYVWCVWAYVRVFEYIQSVSTSPKFSYCKCSAQYYEIVPLRNKIDKPYFLTHSETTNSVDICILNFLIYGIERKSATENVSHSPKTSPCETWKPLHFDIKWQKNVMDLFGPVHCEAATAFFSAIFEHSKWHLCLYFVLRIHHTRNSCTLTDSKILKLIHNIFYLARFFLFACKIVPAIHEHLEMKWKSLFLLLSLANWFFHSFHFVYN